MTKLPLHRQLAAAFCLFPLAAMAQTGASKVPSLDEIVVTPSRSAESLAEAMGDVTVIGQEELAAARGDSITEILARQPGVQFTTNGGPQTVTSVYLRGNDPKHTLVLIDGMRINNTATGSTAFNTLDPAMIERIEILRGAASSLYGSDAIGGVINIITRKGGGDRPFAAWANAGYGSYETSRLSMGFSGASHGWDYSFGTSAANSKGFDAMRKRFSIGTDNPAHYPDKDGFRSHSVSGSLGYTWAPGHRIGLTAYNSFMKGDYDTSYFDMATFTDKPIEKTYAFYRQQAYSLDSTNRITDWWESELRFGLTKDSYDDRAHANVTSQLKRHYSWNNSFRLHPDHRLSVLLERQEERVKSTTEYGKTSRNTNAAALIYKGRFDRLHAQASLRNDNYTDYGSKTTGSLGLDFDITDTWQVGIAGNTGFRMPTFTDLYAPAGWGGNPKLKPESSRNIEAHVQYKDEASMLRLTVYQNRVNNLIAFDGPSGLMQNINKARIRGLSLQGSHDFGDTRVYASADFVDPRNADPAPGENPRLIRRARQVYNLGVEHRIHGWTLGAEYKYTGKRYDNVYNSTTFATEQTTLGGFSLVNLTAAYDFNKSLGVQVRWNNIFNKDYVLIDGYNTPGSNVFVNLSWRM